MSDRRQMSLSFCSVPPAPGRAGGAVLVGDGTLGGTKLVEMTCRSLLNWVQGTRMTDFYSANPYRGCQFGCLYCYARYTHEYLGLDPSEGFEQRVFVKVDAPAAFARDLKRATRLSAGIHLGSATDPYQPAEARFGLTRRILQTLLPLREVPLTIATKSVLVERDADLLAELSRRHEVTVMMTCVTLDARLQREVEPQASPTERRLSALEALSVRGVKVGLLLAPVMPGLNDREQDLLALCKRARQAGATTLLSQVLFLPEATKRAFLPWLRVRDPALHGRYLQALRGGRQLGGPLRAQAEARLARVRQAAGFSSVSDRR